MQDLPSPRLLYIVHEWHFAKFTTQVKCKHHAGTSTANLLSRVQWPARLRGLHVNFSGRVSLELEAFELTRKSGASPTIWSTRVIHLSAAGDPSVLVRPDLAR